MPTYQAPIRDTQYVLNAIAGLPALATRPAFEHVNSDVVQSILEAGGDFVSDHLAPLNAIGDQGCTHHDDGRVSTPPGFRDAYQTYCEAGWSTLIGPAQFGGQALPQVLWLAFEQFVLGANMSFSAYLSLTNGVVAVLLAHGTDELRRLYLAHLIRGEWSGTMNLTEPQCGSDLSLVRTRARRVSSSEFAISGTKIFITSGEHDLTDNIVHLVLARIEDAPSGVRGLSLFLVPKMLVAADGSLGARNQVFCRSIEHKMGLNGSATCTMSYEEAKGFLVGEEGKGLAAMFVMMNLARLHVGIQALGAADAAYQHAVGYARERRQGRAVVGTHEPNQAADPIIVHPDVRRMLMECKAVTEGNRAFCLWTAAQADLAAHPVDSAEAERATDLLSLLTPVVKAFVSESSFLCTITAQQVFGGHGYIRETGAEQSVRDARITMIYEGTNGIQAMDLAARKIMQHGGKAVRQFLTIIDEEIDVATRDPELHRMAASLKEARNELEHATRWLTEFGSQHSEHIGAGAHSYLELLGKVSLGLMWLKMAHYSNGARQRSGEERAFHDAKVATAEFYFDRILPDVHALRAKISSGSRSTMRVPPDQL
jgi:alkylation response protein AidB-like acyl-CoA dehydrogenase